MRKYIEVKKEKHSLKRRGRKSKKFSLEDKLLLTFYYLRHYSTFIKLGIEFGISESYANKIYHQIMKILVRILKESRLAIHPDIVKYADSGYQGIHKIYLNTHTPIKKTKKKQLPDADKKHNRGLSKKKDIR